MTPELQREMQVLRDEFLSRQVLMEYKQTKRNMLTAYAEVAPVAVSAAKRKAAADLLEKLALTYVAHRPKLTWYEPLQRDERALIDDGSYLFKFFLDSRGLLGFYHKGGHLIGLNVDQPESELLVTLAHEYAHSLGMSDESDADQFALMEAA